MPSAGLPHQNKKKLTMDSVSQQPWLRLHLSFVTSLGSPPGPLAASPESGREGCPEMTLAPTSEGPSSNFPSAITRSLPTNGNTRIVSRSACFSRRSRRGSGASTSMGQVLSRLFFEKASNEGSRGNEAEWVRNRATCDLPK